VNEKYGIKKGVKAVEYVRLFKNLSDEFLRSHDFTKFISTKALEKQEQIAQKAASGEDISKLKYATTFMLYFLNSFDVKNVRHPPDTTLIAFKKDKFINSVFDNNLLLGRRNQESRRIIQRKQHPRSFGREKGEII
jgi:hypothetical protein